ncbi:MAG: hypothetical protein AAGH74_08960 [Pseudomonadota bacterium]
MYHRTIPAPLWADLARSLYNAGARLTRWMSQTHQRIQAHGKLSQLNDHMLRDIGIDRRDLLLRQSDHGSLERQRLTW